MNFPRNGYWGDRKLCSFCMLFITGLKLIAIKLTPLLKMFGGHKSFLWVHCIGFSMAAEPFQSTYLQTCPQALVDIWGSNPWCVVSMWLLLELDCFCLPNIVTEDILGHKILLPRTFLATNKLLPSTFTTTNKFNLLLRKYAATTCLLPRKF